MSTKNKEAFTLIEMLVVVLIIGILAAVALPQYQKSAWKARTMQLQQSCSDLAKAQNIFFLTNASYSNNFSALDINFDSLPKKSSSSAVPYAVASTDAIRANDLMEIGISVNSDGGIYAECMFIKGPYKYGGFIWAQVGTQGIITNKLMCQESPRMTPAGSFCQKVMGADYHVTSYGGWRQYPLK